MAPRLPKRALVTGASSGIGLAFVQYLASLGVDLVCVSNDQAGLDQAVADLRAAHPDRAIDAFCIDLTLTDAPERCLAFCDERSLEIELLVNNAGIFVFEPLLDAAPAKVAAMISLHVACVTRMCVVFGQRMKQARFGYILNMSSLSAWMAMPGINVYNATKAYIRNLSRALASELAPFGVGVTVICPGGIDTALFGLPPNLRKIGVRLGILMRPQTLVRRAVKVTLRRKIEAVPGIFNHVLMFICVTMPNFLVRFVMNHLSIYAPFRNNDKQQNKIADEAQ